MEESQEAVLLTSDTWYQLERDVDIIDADGWRFGMTPKEQCHYWFHVPIAYEEYSRRRNRCTVMAFGEMNHRVPYQEADLTDASYEWDSSSELESSWSDEDEEEDSVIKESQITTFMKWLNLS